MTEQKIIVFLHSELFLKHLHGFSHPESPERLLAIHRMLKNSLISEHISFVEAEPADREWLYRIHSRAYVDTILSLEIGSPLTLDWGDTVATEATPQAALYAAGAGVQAVSLVYNGEFPAAFCAVRPPGHHAERSRAMGFCLFNNIAVAAAHLVDDMGVDRVVIADWDVHHGNGTEEAFIEDPRVLYISMHQYPYYPGTGHPAITGTGKASGFNINIPMKAGSGDQEYYRALSDHVLPAIDDFKPQFMLMSAGFDAHRDDPLAGMALTSSAYGEITRLLKESAERHCGGRIVSFLEGGYNLRALAESVEEHLWALVGEGSPMNAGPPG